MSNSQLQERAAAQPLLTPMPRETSLALPKANGAPTALLAIMAGREVSADNACTDGPYHHRCPLTLQPA